MEGCGTVKSDVKGFNKQTLHANDKVDIIRMNNNPKGKILIRTQNQSCKTNFCFLTCLKAQIHLRIGLE